MAGSLDSIALHYAIVYLPIRCHFIVTKQNQFSPYIALGITVLIWKMKKTKIVRLAF